MGLRRFAALFVGLSESGGLFVRLAEVASILLVAGAVRMLDDAIDEPQTINTATVSYVSILVACAAALSVTTAITLFLACYSWGMTGNLGRLLPSGLTCSAEALLAVLIGAWRFGPIPMLAALSIVAFIQAVDDVMDYDSDRERGASTWATRWGRVETLLFGLLGLCICLQISLFLAVAAPAAAWLVTVYRDCLAKEECR
jgi:4-hydroxybenzoate polyprenyltransferase